MIVPSWNPALRYSGYLNICKGLFRKILVMMLHVYNTRNNLLSTIKENASPEANFKASESSILNDTANLIIVWKNSMVYIKKYWIEKM